MFMKMEAFKIRFFNSKPQLVCRPDRIVPQAYSGNPSDKNSFNLYDGNLEREMGSEDFSLGQVRELS